MFLSQFLTSPLLINMLWVISESHTICTLVPIYCNLFKRGFCFFFQVTTLARKHPLSLEWCHILPIPGPFWYIVSKKFYDHLVIIHIIPNEPLTPKKIKKKRYGQTEGRTNGHTEWQHNFLFFPPPWYTPFLSQISKCNPNEINLSLYEQYVHHLKIAFCRYLYFFTLYSRM